MRLSAWYHIWADGKWREPLAEFREALHEADFPGPVFYVVVGGCPAAEFWDEWYEHGVIAAEWHHGPGNEYLTLNALRRYASLPAHEGEAILYAHTKGAYSISGMRDRWRRSMTNRVVRGWRENLEWLASGDFDAVGCHWLTEAGFPGMFGPMTVPTPGSGFFGGNFWMATTDYLRGLPECPADPRWQAESWIGANTPRVVDLLPGWPHDNRWPELCA